MPAPISAQISADGQLTYTPQADYNGNDQVSFELVSGTSSNRYEAYLKVRPVNDAAPVASDVTLLAPGGGTLRGALPAASDIDRDPITYAATANAKNGEVVVAADGSFRYTARAGFEGSDSFKFIVGDGMGGSNTYTAAVFVVPVEASTRWVMDASCISGRSWWRSSSSPRARVFRSSKGSRTSAIRIR